MFKDKFFNDWPVSKNGNPYLNCSTHNLGLFERRDDLWGWRALNFDTQETEFSDDGFRTQRDAKEDLWAYMEPIWRRRNEKLRRESDERFLAEQAQRREQREADMRRLEAEDRKNPIVTKRGKKFIIDFSRVA